MQRKIDELNRSIENQDRTIEALRERKEELLRIREVRAKADSAWARAIAERTGDTVPTNHPIQPEDSR